MDQPGFKPKYWGANTTGPSTANGTEPATSAEADEILPVNPFDLEREEQDVDHGMLPLDPELSLTNYYINVSLTRVLDVESSTYRLEVKITPYLMDIETGNFELSTGSNFLIRSISLMQTGSGGSNQRGYNAWIINPSSETSTTDTWWRSTVTNSSEGSYVDSNSYDVITQGFHVALQHGTVQTGVRTRPWKEQIA